MSEEIGKKEILLFIIAMGSFIAFLFYLNIKEHKDFISNCEKKGGTIIYQDYPKKTYCNLESRGN